MKTFRIKIAGLLLIAGVFLVPAFGQPYRYGRMDQRQGRNMVRQDRTPYWQHRSATRQQWRGDRAGLYGYAALELTEEQQEKLSALRSEHQEQMEPLRKSLAEARATQRTLLSEEKVDMEAVNRSIDEQTDLMNQMSKLRVEHSVNIRGVLTDEQRQKLEIRQDFSRQRRPYGNGFSRSPRRGRF